MAYNPSIHTTTQKAMGFAHGVPADARAKFYDVNTFTYRPYNGTVEVLSEITGIHRTSHTFFVVDVSGVIKLYWFKDEVNLTELVQTEQNYTSAEKTKLSSLSPLPDQTNHNGHGLFTDGSNPYWSIIRQVPQSFNGQQNQVLTVSGDGTTYTWLPSNPPVPSLHEVASVGNETSQGIIVGNTFQVKNTGNAQSIFSVALFANKATIGGKPLYFSPAGGVGGVTIETNGKLGVNKGIADILQADLDVTGTGKFTGNVSGLSATLPDHFVTLSQLDTVKAGSAATVQVGNTSTGNAGTNAIVTNTGTTQNAIFNFVIPRGAQGIQGVQGIQGPIGSQGIQGIQGPIGPKGDTGLTGPQGIQGPIGSTGPTGPTGPKGDTGLTGPAGIQGEVGPQGPIGLTGPQGEEGPQGEQGVPGIGIPTGGTTNQILAKLSPTNFDTHWIDAPTAGDGGITVETDPTVPAHVKAISTTNISNWNTAFGWGNHATQGYIKTYTETDPVWNTEKTNYYTKVNHQTSGQSSVHWNNITNKPTLVTTESDPTVGSHIKAITVLNISNWNTAFSWGNHATVGYLTAESDTFQSVTARGATSSIALTSTGGITVGSANNLKLNTDGSIVALGSVTTNATVRFNTGTVIGSLNGTTIDAARTWTLPNKSGTVALTSDIVAAAVPTLQQVLTQGNTSNIGIILGNNKISLSEDGTALFADNVDFRANITTTANINFTRGAQSGSLGVPTLTTARAWNLPDASGTIALQEWVTSRGYITSYTETDPSVPSHVKAITLANISNWNTAYGWGNHAGLYKPISYVPTWNEITGKPTFFSGNYNDLTNKPTIPNAQVNSDWNAVSGISQILNKPTNLWTSDNRRSNSQDDARFQPIGTYISYGDLAGRIVADANEPLHGTDFYFLNGLNKPGNLTDGVLQNYQYNEDFKFQTFGDWRTGEYYSRGKANGLFANWRQFAMQDWSTSMFHPLEPQRLGPTNNVVFNSAYTNEFNGKNYRWSPVNATNWLQYTLDNDNNLYLRDLNAAQMMVIYAPYEANRIDFTRKIFTPSAAIGDLYLTDLIGSGTRVLGVDSTGKVVITTPSGGGSPQDLQQTTELGNTTSEDIEITDATKGIILNTSGGRKARIRLVEDNGGLTLSIEEIISGTTSTTTTQAPSSNNQFNYVIPLTLS